MRHFSAIMAIAISLLAVGCAKKTTEPVDVIPIPKSVTAKQGTFSVAGAPVSYDASIDAKAKSHIQNFAQRLTTTTGKPSMVQETPAKKGFVFSISNTLADEEYSIAISKKAVKVAAGSYKGILYAIQTLGQLLPVEFWGKDAAPQAKWTLPCYTIKDKPRFAYRGMHLDVCRHFFDVNEVKKYLDVMALHKMNRFHWHLTDDQGWRIEIKSYPKLTEIGAFRDETMVRKNFSPYVGDGKRYGGFYTQEQIKEVVAYAESLGITVIPEVDLPGHMVAALASYPELGCSGGPYKVWTMWGVDEHVLCPGKEATFKFLESVLTEIMELFPSEYIHIGGDECPKTEWAKCPDCQKRIKELGLKADDKHTAETYLQNYVTERVQKFLNDHGRKIIGWDEILEGNLAKGATVMSWRGVEGGIEAAEKGFDAIMTPNSYMYFDYYQSEDHDKEPFGIGGRLPIDTVYAYEPLKGISADKTGHILGVQANLWTEYIGSNEHLEYMALPRMDALSEVQWCDPGQKDFERFVKSLKNMCAIYDKLGYTYSKDVFGEIGLPGHEGHVVDDK